MARSLAEDIVRFLSFGDKTTFEPCQLRTGSAREWKSTMTWLDQSGLALYFLQRLQATHACSHLPTVVLLQLEQRLHDNELRVARLKEMFGTINRRFEDAGVQYAVMKGFSLVPEYCVDPSFRSQSDLDYLIAKDSIDGAQRVLIEQGFVLKEQSGEELSFWIPAAEPTKWTQQYSPNGPWMVELHLSLWDQSLLRVPLRLPEPPFMHLRMQQWSGLRFPCLPRHLMFAAQILHALKHVLDGWVRLSWLFEINYFLRHEGTDSSFWRPSDPPVAEETSLAEFSALISCLAVALFEAPLPSAIRAYGSHLCPSTQIWLRDYARGWLFEKVPRYELSFFSPAKLALFLREQYASGPHADVDINIRSLFPWRRFKHLLEGRGPGTTTMQAVGYKCRWLAVHLIYHAGANLRYAWELPRWRYRTRPERVRRELQNRPSLPRGI
jgi:hypothetical protein